MVRPPVTCPTRADDTRAGPLTDVVGVGTDLVDVDNMRDLLASGGNAFLDSVWTKTEQRDSEGSPERLAGRWAAKEAVMKAIGHGLGDVDPLDVETVRLDRGALEVRLHESAATAARLARIHRVLVSISHESKWAISFAIAIGAAVDEKATRLRKDKLEED